MSSCLNVQPSSAPALVDQNNVASYADLCSFCDRFDAALIAAGVPVGATVASSLESDMWGAAVAVAAVRNWTHAPQNPSLRRAQLDERLAMPGVAALVVGASESERAVDVAGQAGMAVVRIAPGAAGLAETDFAVERSASSDHGESRPDLAVILHTSGTTATPNTVPISRANVAASVANMVQAFALTSADRALLVMPLPFVHSLMSSLLVPLSAGASVICPGPYDAPAFLGWLSQLSPTYYSAVPTVHQSILDRIGSHPHELNRHTLRFVRSSAAALPERTRTGLEQALGVPVVEGYAMTETTSQITSNPLPPTVRKPSSVGLSVGPRIQIVDADGAELQPGDTGGIRVQGPSVVEAYLDDPAKTAKRFQDGWLITGDSGYMDTDGYLFLTGRTDEVIRRGAESVSTAAVEAALLEHQLVHEALVFAVPDTRLGHQVGAAVVADSGANEADLRQHVFRRRSPAEVPRRILVVDKLPTSSRGKPLRTGAAEFFGLHDLDRAGQERSTVAPRNDLERDVAAMWSEVLATDIPGVHHHFFELGGDSLLVKTLLLRARDRWGLDIPFIDFFDALTVAEQAALLTHLIETGAVSPAQPDELPATDPDESFPLSSAQERLWILEQIEAGQANYHIPLTVEIDGEVDIGRLERAFTQVIERHETLRTRVLGLVGDTPMQQVAPSTAFQIQRGELPADPHTTTALVADHLARPFDLASGRLIRALLLSGHDQHVLSVVVHHIAGDGRSVEIFSTELSAAYERASHEEPPEPPAAQYRDFVAWEGRRRAGEAYEEELDAWGRRFDPTAAPLALPYDRRPDSAPGGPAQAVPIPVEQLTAAMVRCVARQTEATPFMVLLAANAATLAELTKTASVTIGTPSEDRAWPPSTPLIGYFVNTLPLAVDCSGEPTFRELVRRVRRVALAAYQGGEVSFDDIVARVNPPRIAAHTPLYDVMFTATVGRRATPTLGGAHSRPHPGLSQRIKSSLELDMRILDDDVVGTLAYDTRWFNPETAENMAALLGRSLDRLIANPDDLALDGSARSARHR